MDADMLALSRTRRRADGRTTWVTPYHPASKPRTVKPGRAER